MPMFFGIWIVILAGSISLMLGNVFIVFNFTLTLCIMIYIERWIRKDNKKYRIDWFWGRKKQK